jgi:lysyl-tRNA synthetase class II
MGIVDATMGKGKLIDFTENVKATLFNQHLLLIIQSKTLCKEHRDNPEQMERFELMVCGA